MFLISLLALVLHLLQYQLVEQLELVAEVAPVVVELERLEVLLAGHLVVGPPVRKRLLRLLAQVVNRCFDDMSARRIK